MLHVHGGSSLSAVYLAAAAASAAAGYATLPALRALKLRQVQRRLGPAAHASKAGTPTMGGLAFVPIGCAVALLAAGPSAELLALCGATLGCLTVGLVDDALIVTRGKNDGLHPKLKLGAQLAVAAAFCAFCYGPGGVGAPTAIAANLSALGHGVARLELGAVLCAPFAMFVFAAESNGANLTDGLDGLAAGVAAAALAAMAAASLAAECAPAATFCAALAGASVGFLAHNAHKASMFMGDTGSLALGGALASVGVLTAQFVPLAIATAVFAAEAASVIAQVAYFKATKGPDGVGKRLFKMAPFHHHLEACGWHETTVVAAAYAASLVCALCAAAIAA